MWLLQECVYLETDPDSGSCKCSFELLKTKNSNVKLPSYFLLNDVIIEGNILAKLLATQCFHR
jgi:hypothetical protein